MSGNLKICGILIENIVKTNSLEAFILGIGLNVNQKKFVNLPKAGSLSSIMNNNFDIDDILTLIIQKIEKNFSLINVTPFHKYYEKYQTVLFKYQKPSTFINPQGDTFVGMIQGVTQNGKLQILIEDNNIQLYDLKEIQMLY